MSTSLLVSPSGNAAPRTRNVQPYNDSFGREAADLAESAGLILDPWQRSALEDAFAVDEHGLWLHRRVAIIVPRQNGKGAILEAMELAALFLLQEPLILHSAHEYKTAMEAFRRILYLIENTPDLRKRVKSISRTNGEESIELVTGERLRFAARSKGSGRGFSCRRLVWDEGYALTPPQVEAQLPTMSAQPNPQVVYTSSPPLDAVTGEVLMRVRERALEGDPGLCYLDWGSPRGVDLDDQEEWAAANPGYLIRISPDFVREERGAMTDEGFGRERLGVWPASVAEQWQVIGERAWFDAQDEESRRVGTIALSLAMSLNRQWTCAAIAGARADGLRHVEIVKSERGSGWVVDWVKAFVVKHRPCAVLVNPAGPEGSLIPDLEAAGVEVVRLTARDEAQACGSFIDGVAGELPEEGTSPRTVRHRGQGVLTTAIAGAITRKSSGAQTWDMRGSTVDISPAIAASNALHGHTVHGMNVLPPPATARSDPNAGNFFRSGGRLAL